MSYFDPLFYGLLVTNVVAYSLLAFGYIWPKLARIPKNLQVNVAFAILEDALTRSFPDLPSGFTWEEGITRAKSLKLRVKWPEIEQMLLKYEAHRYGRMDLSGDPREVLKLAYSLPRKPKYDPRVKR